MGQLSKDSKDFMDALEFFDPRERSEFFRWSRSTSEFEGVTKHMLFGHPYYIFSPDNETALVGPALESILPAHRASITDFNAQTLGKAREYIGKMFFLRLHQASAGRESMILALPMEGVHSYCVHREGAQRLTAAELHALGQIMSGLETKEAATRDDVSYETKRTHIKSLNAKLGFTRQIDLVAEVISGLLMEIVANSETASEMSVFESYIKRYAPRSARFHRVIGPKGQVIRLIDLGDPQGRPIIGIHPSLIGMGAENYEESLRREKIRMIWPVRDGFLTDEDRLLPYNEHLENALAGISEAIKFVGNHAATLYAIGPGAFLAVEAARRWPHSVQKIIFQSAGTQRSTKLFASQKIMQSISRLARKSPLTLHLMLKFINSKMNNPTAILSFLENIYVNSPKDLEVVRAEFGPPEFGERFRIAIKHSMRSILHDFRFAEEDIWGTAARIDTPLVFIHGTEDGAFPIAEIPKLIDRLGRGRFMPIEGAGNLMTYRHGAEVMDAMVAAIRD